MKKIDYMGLDGRVVRTFLVVLAEGSISRAADKLGVTQSAVSHSIARLREALGDPLFVRLGRGIAPTGRARELREPMQRVLDNLKALSDQRVFDPASETIEFTIAANDHQRKLLFTGLYQQERAKGVDLRVHFVESGVPAVRLMNEGLCQLLITPFPPDGAELVQVRLFEDTPACFYDKRMRNAPSTPREFFDADRVDVRFGDGRSASAPLLQRVSHKLNPPVCTVSNFPGLSDFVLNTDAVTVQGKLFAQTFLSELSMAPLPFKLKSFGMYLVWHRRDTSDPAHRWLRERIKDVASTIA